MSGLYGNLELPEAKKNEAGSSQGGDGVAKSTAKRGSSFSGFMMPSQLRVKKKVAVETTARPRSNSSSSKNSFGVASSPSISTSSSSSAVKGAFHFHGESSSTTTEERRRSSLNENTAPSVRVDPLQQKQHSSASAVQQEEIFDPYNPAEPNDYAQCIAEREALKVSKALTAAQDALREKISRERKEAVENSKSKSNSSGSGSKIMHMSGEGRNKSNIPSWLEKQLLEQQVIAAAAAAAAEEGTN
jgi:hypothetical protein